MNRQPSTTLRPPAMTWLVVGLSLAAALAATLVVSEQIMITMWDHGHDRWRIFTWQLSAWAFWAVVSPILLDAGARLFHSRPWWRRLPVTLAIVLGLITLQVLVVSAVATLLQPFEPIETFSFGGFLLRHIPRYSTSNLLAATGLLIVGHMLASYRHANRLELRETRLGAELARAQLESLRLQIEPHFLFNTLNSIAALIRRGDDEPAVKAVIELGELLRDTLESGGGHLVPLAEEWSFVERYIHLQRIRFTDRLRVESAIPADCREALVPPLFLQTLIENCLRHGLREQSEPITLEISAEREGARLIVQVKDDGPGLPAGFDLPRDQGVGLGNLTSRLHQLFGADAELRLKARQGRGTRASVSLPLRFADGAVAGAADSR